MWQYVKGFCIVSIEGLYLEKFINYLVNNGIYLFNIRRISPTKIEAYIYRDDVKNLIYLYKKSDYNLKIKRSIGLPFLMKRIYKRKSLLIGGILSLFILVFLTTFITNVYIDCPEGINKSELRKELYNCGLKPWVNKYMIDKKDIRDSILSKFDDIAYIFINIEGTNAFVEIVKKSEEPEENTKINCNIIAKKDGIIEKVIPRSGEALVSKGNIVKKGDVLIAGGNVIAKGEVWARTFYEIKESIEYINKDKIKTGKSKKTYKIKFFNKTYYIKRNIPYKNYYIRKRILKCEYKKFKVPIEVEINTFYEVNVKDNKKDIEKLKNIIRQKALKKIDYLLPVQARIINKKEDYKIKGNVLEFIVTIQALEDIGKDEKIEGGNYIDNTEKNRN
ncbi:sporulation protein YqfD [Tepidibacter thalassicus]|uniref:Similar to stage IV sporulation protein n=1 Tax=Tepidibacter thalassicus DSM 15285 TaxID=1123350 RepID=A0A1M5NPH0_9FIRM|nr:sporulation protein YqfD [Tepidibacter thalassicus]SHG91089.1 similar to stage IV sporulation protein [Tepidibacter thalassicus DSM 15285]